VRTIHLAPLAAAVLAAALVAGAAHGSRTGDAAPMHPLGAPVVVASGIQFPTSAAFDAHGRLWITSGIIGQTPSEGIWYVPRAGRPRLVTGGFAGISLLWDGNRLYVSGSTKPGVGEITVFSGFDGNRFASRHVRLGGIRVGTHTIGSLARGPDGRFYLGYGAENDQVGHAGGVLSFLPAGGAATKEATGLRTAYGLAFWGSRLLVSVSGPDKLHEPPDELQSFQPSGPLVDFGYPRCFGQGGAACMSAPPPLAKLAPHATPTQLVVKGDVAYVGEFGSAVAQTPKSQIVRIDLRTGHVSVFWRSPVQHDVIGLALGPDGNLYATLFSSGKVVRFDL